VLKAPRDRARYCWSDRFLPGAGGARAPSSGSGTGTRAPPANLYSWPESLTLFRKGRECSLLPSQHPPSRSNGASSDSDDSRGGRQSGPVTLNQVVSGATRPFEPECLDRGDHSVNGGLRTSHSRARDHHVRHPAASTGSKTRPRAMSRASGPTPAAWRSASIRSSIPPSRECRLARNRLFCAAQPPHDYHPGRRQSRQRYARIAID
jgi:hypothetical protein